MKTLRSAWQILASWLLCFIVGPFACLVVFLTLGTVRRRFTPWILGLWGHWMLWIAGVRITVEGAEHLATDTHKVALFNHGSVLDAFLVTAIMPAGGTAAIKNEVMLYGPVGITVKLLGFLMIDRGNSPKARRTMERAAERMRRERLTVFISPEGTRSPVGELLPFKKGAFHLALDSGAPIVPVLFDGAFDLHPPGRFTTTPGLVRIRILPPRPTHFTAADVATEAEAVRQLYLTELARFRAERTAPAARP